MLALILGLVSASVPLQQCNNVTSCFLQVNGTRPLIKLIGSLPNGGVGHTFTTADCMLGLIAIDENCQCQNATLYGSSYNPSFCYSSGDWAKTQDITNYVSFCKNQNGLNTFSLLNSTFYTQCKCFDPASGSEETATIERPVCKKGKSSYKPCASTDGTGDNAAVLAKYTGATLKAIMDLNQWSWSPSKAFPKCACGSEDCRSSPETEMEGAEDNRYCQADISHCSRFKICPKGVFEPKDTFADQECACGFGTCYAGTKCESKVIDGIKEFVCTLEGKSSNLGLQVKQMIGSATLTFVFGLMAFIFLLLIMLFSILACCKVNKK